MKKFFSLCIYILPALTSYAQVTSLNENFNVSCASSTGFPVGWIYYNPVAGTAPSGAWMCNPTEGRGETPGMECTGYYSGTASTPDTSLLITPELDLSSYTGNIYLQFDTKTAFINNERLTVVVSPDSTFTTGAIDSSTLALTPTIAPPYDTAWITEQADLTRYKGAPFYIAFMYTSPDTYGTKWFLDNVLTTTVSLQVTAIDKEKIPLAVIGTATTSEIKLSYYTTTGGDYDLVIYDMLGRILDKQVLHVQTGPATSTITGLNLLPGMLFIRMGNGINYGTAKAMIE